MSKDIAERLRDAVGWEAAALAGEAADVIDALWAEIDRLDSRNKSLDAQCMAMHAEIERLTAAHKHQYEMAGLMLREAERNSKDAERYRFLRDDPEGYRIAEMFHREWDDRIDLAMKEKA